MGKNVTLGLSQIVKNEAHVITRMLDSAAHILDYITIVDTGSTDNTEEVIKNWAKEHNIPCDIHHREFDNFENCRNYAMQMSKDKTDYSFWLDADEILHVDPKQFDKNKLDKDLYMFNTNIGAMKYTRNELWTNKKNFKWYGPVHEFIVPGEGNDQKSMSSGIAPGINVEVKMDGGSWKDVVSTKYRTHASMLEDYIDNKDRDPRWVFYTAQSYHDSACVLNNEAENKERLRRAIKYYKERLSMPTGYHEERFYAQFRIGTVMYRLQRPWIEVKDQLLKAYSMDPVRGEPYRIIIEHYQQLGDWNMAYLYSKAAYEIFNQKNPYPNRVLFVDNTLYTWRFAEFYANSCYYTNRKKEASHLYRQLMKMVQQQPEFFTAEDVNRFTTNSKFFIQN